MMLDKNKVVVDKLMDDLRFIDPESPRHIDWVFLHRATNGCDTQLGSYSVPNNRVGAKMKSVEASANIPAIAKRMVDDGFDETKTDSFSIRSDETSRFYVLNDGVIIIEASISVNESHIDVVVTGDGRYVKQFLENIKRDFAAPNKITITRVVGYDSRGDHISFSDEFLDNDPSILLANDSFYPYMDKTIDELAESFKESRASILFFIGDMGLGKTTLIRTLIFKMGLEHCAMMAGDGVVEHPAFIQTIHSFSKKTLIGVEDADRLCLAREDGNQHMAGLLNFADGVSSIGNKIIISTNLSSVNKVDSALLRSGRTFEIIEFKKLTAEQANVARESVGLEPVDFGDIETISLADALNFDDNTIVDRKKTTGFL